MLKKFRKEVPSIYDEPINKVLGVMNNALYDSEEFTAAMHQLEVLTKLKADERKSRRVSPDQMAAVVGSLLGIVAIVAYEQKHVVTTKAIGMLPKVRN